MSDYQRFLDENKGTSKQNKHFASLLLHDKIVAENIRRGNTSFKMVLEKLYKQMMG